MDITAITFDRLSAETKNVPDIGGLPDSISKKIMWINVSGLEDIQSIAKIAKKYSIHPLTVEDIFNTRQQPKVEKFEGYSYISFKSIHREKSFHDIRENSGKKSGRAKNKVQEEKNEFRIDQISMIIMKNVILTFREQEDDPFYGVRKRILENTGQMKRKGTDFLAYSLIEAAVDDYHLIIGHLQEDIENLEDRAVKTSDDNFILEIQETKKYLFQIRQSILPLRDNLATIARQKILKLDEDQNPFLQDLQENLGNAIQSVENCRDWLSNIMQVNLSVLSYQMNKVMKILTTVSSIFIPLTFIAGVYGMNFENMPELVQPWGYPVILCGMGLIAVGMLLFFRKRHWF